MEEGDCPDHHLPVTGSTFILCLIQMVERAENRPKNVFCEYTFDVFHRPSH